MELIAKISKGSNMDQIYLPKNRSGLNVGSYVIVKPIETKKFQEKPYFYGTKGIEPVKIGIAYEIMNIVSHNIVEYENIFIVGSFLEEGFCFNDIDILIVGDKNINEASLREKILDKAGIKAHLIVMNNDALMKGLASDPLYQMMLSKTIAKKRFIYHIKKEINYKLLDLHLLKSKSLIDNFNSLNGDEKYYLTRNMIAILEFLQNKRITKEFTDKRVENIFNIKDVREIKQNMLKKEFLQKFREIYKKTSGLIMEGINHGSK
ncbi:MAG: hypothetical protein HYW27_01480 [Candidatus Aenigmarchaeota archaeon]|nr:hypothetical protein [Candidatus Aenigmarchaeota archaeon]